MKAKPSLKKRKKEKKSLQLQGGKILPTKTDRVMMLTVKTEPRMMVITAIKTLLRECFLLASHHAQNFQALSHLSLITSYGRDVIISS